MTPLVFVLGSAAFCFLVFMLVSMIEHSKTSRKLREEENRHNQDMRELREKYLSNLETGNLREALLKRAMQDLADAEIDRARFTLEVVYGKTSKKS